MKGERGGDNGRVLPTHLKIYFLLYSILDFFILLFSVLQIHQTVQEMKRQFGNVLFSFMYSVRMDKGLVGGTDAEMDPYCLY